MQQDVRFEWFSLSSDLYFELLWNSGRKINFNQLQNLTWHGCHTFVISVLFLRNKGEFVSFVFIMFYLEVHCLHSLTFKKIKKLFNSNLKTKINSAQCFFDHWHRSTYFNKHMSTCLLWRHHLQLYTTRLQQHRRTGKQRLVIYNKAVSNQFWNFVRLFTS